MTVTLNSNVSIHSLVDIFKVSIKLGPTFKESFPRHPRTVIFHNPPKASSIPITMDNCRQPSSSHNLDHVTCRKCSQKGHYPSNCPRFTRNVHLTQQQEEIDDKDGQRNNLAE